MASCQTSQWVSTSPYVRLTVVQSSSSATSSTLSWTLEYVASSAASTSAAKSYTVKLAGETVKTGTYSINGKTGTSVISSGTKTISKATSAKTVSFSVSFSFNMSWSGTYAGTKSASGSISIPAKTSYSIKYNANGGSGAPSSQTKWYGTTLTLSSTKPTRTGYTFKGWATSASGSVSYASGASYTSNASVTLYAVWQAITYTVKFDANGGSGAPGNQTKTYGTTLKLSTTTPTRTNYTFKGWGTSASATTVSYAAGANYTANANITLYAIWSLAYTKPRITNYSVNRCVSKSDGTASDSGTYFRIRFNWACDKTSSSLTIKWKESTESLYSALNTVTRSLTGTSGNVDEILGYGYISVDSSYDVTVIVTDSGGSTTYTLSLEGTKYVIDILAGGNGIAFGKPAESTNSADFGFSIMPNGGFTHPVIPFGTDLNSIRTPNIYAGGIMTSSNVYGNAPVTSGSFTLYVDEAGASGQIRQRFVTCNKTTSKVFERYYYTNTWGDWVCTSDFQGVILWTGSWYMNGSQTATLSDLVSNQATGIVLVFSEYYKSDSEDSASAKNQSWTCKFVPKKLIGTHNGNGHSFILNSNSFGYVASKYLYIHNDKIVGHDDNSTTGTGASGIKYTNNRFVLRYVIGV